MELLFDTLKNGIRLVHHPLPGIVAHCGLVINTGSRDESVAEHGIAHFIEHMLYKGTPSRDAKKIAEEIEKNGGKLNGFTDEAITAYFCKMPSRKLPIALDVLIDMVKNPLFDEKELEKERKVIFEEIKMRKDNPAIYVMDKINGFLYDKPFGVNLIGDTKTMSSIDRKKMLARFKEIYNPNNMILCIVGDADFDEIINVVEKNFGNEKGEVPKFEIKKQNKIQIEKRKGLDQANLIFAYHVPLASDEKNYAAQVLSALMASGMSSRLFTEIREKRNLAYTVSGSSEINRDFAYNFIHVGTSKENVEKVKELILEEFEKIPKELDEKELDQVKEYLIGNHQISVEESLSQMLNLLMYEISGDAKEFYSYEEKIRSVKLGDVKKLAESVKNKYSFFALVPE